MNKSRSAHLPRVGPLHTLHAHALRPPGPGVALLLGHPLAVGPERPHALGPRLVHPHGRAAHVGSIHARAHVPREGPRAPGTRLVHELAVVRLVGSHLEGGTHLAVGREGRSRSRFMYFRTQSRCFVNELPPDYIPGTSSLILFHWRPNDVSTDGG